MLLHVVANHCINIAEISLKQKLFRIIMHPHGSRIMDCMFEFQLSWNRFEYTNSRGNKILNDKAAKDFDIFLGSSQSRAMQWTFSWQLVPMP